MLIRWQSTIVDQRGNVQPGAVLTIRRMSDQAIVTVYRDRDGTQPYPTGTVTADENGYAYFYATPDLYRITSAVPAIDWPDVNLMAPNVSLGGETFISVAEGLAATSDGEYFSVAPSSEGGGLLDFYRNDAGSAAKIGTYPSQEFVSDQIDAGIASVSSSVIVRGLSEYGQFDDFEDEKELVVADLDLRLIDGPWAILALYQMLRGGDASLLIGQFDSFDDAGDYSTYDLDLRLVDGPAVNLILADGGSVAGASSIGSDEVYADIDEASNTVYFSFLHGQSLLRIKLAPNGANDLFNIAAIDKSPGVDPVNASWTNIQALATDWIPPITLESTGGDGSGRGTVGGNHTINGQLTAHGADWDVWVDGKKISAGEVFKGYANRVTVRWVNNLFARDTLPSETLPDGRYVLQQTVIAHLTAGGIQVWMQNTNIDSTGANVIVYRDGGPQMPGQGWDDSCHYFNGSAQGRQPRASVTTSGASASWPNCWAACLYGPENGYMISWLDHSYGAGDGSYVIPTSARMYRNFNGTWKFYGAIVEDAATGSAGFTFGPGQGWAWHGGYAWAHAGIVSGSSLDSAFVYQRNLKRHLAYAFTSVGDGHVIVDTSLTGLQLSSGEPVGVGGLPVSASGYSVVDELLN